MSSNTPALRRALTITRSRAVSARVGGGLVPTAGFDGAQLAEALVDPDPFGAEHLEAPESDHLALGLARLGGIGERSLERLASDLAQESHELAVAGTVLAGAGTVMLAAAVELGDGTGAEVTELGDFKQDLGATFFEGM